MDQSQKPLAIDWAQVDWTKPNRVLAQELGTLSSHIGYYRRRLGFAGVPIDPRWRRSALYGAFQGVDWALPNQELVERTGLTPDMIDAARRALGQPRSPYPKHGSQQTRHPLWQPTWGGKSPDEWRKLDWTQSLAQLGQQMGVSPERVRQIRVQLGLPVRAWKPVPCKLRKPRVSFHSFAPVDLPQRYQRQRAILRDLMMDATLSFSQIARNHGVTTDTVMVIRQWAARWGTIIPGRLKAGGFWSFTPENLPARYTRQQAILRDLMAAMLRQQEIAAKHGVSPGTVCLVKKWAEKGGTVIPAPPRSRGARPREPRPLP